MAVTDHIPTHVPLRNWNMHMIVNSLSDTSKNKIQCVPTQVLHMYIFIIENENIQRSTHKGENKNQS